MVMNERDAGSMGGCSADLECAGGERCVNGACIVADGDQCTADSQCPVGQICRGDRCVPNPTECVNDGDCPGGGRCTSGQCGPPDPDCVTDRDCENDEACEEGACVGPRRCVRQTMIASPGKCAKTASVWGTAWVDVGSMKTARPDNCAAAAFASGLAPNVTTTPIVERTRCATRAAVSIYRPVSSTATVRPAVAAPTACVSNPWKAVATMPTALGRKCQGGMCVGPGARCNEDGDCAPEKTARTATVCSLARVGIG